VPSISISSLRRQLYNLQQVLQGQLNRPIKIENRNRLFELSDCAADAAEMLNVATDVVFLGRR
jgi:hypothetical protein